MVLTLLAVTPVGMAFGQPSIAAILNGASYSSTLAPGCWAVIFGTDLASAPATAQNVPLPPSLGGVSVSVAGIPAPLLYVSQTQINFLIPFEAPAGGTADVTVSSGDTAIASYSIPLAQDAPAIFTQNAQGTGPALVFTPSFVAQPTVASGDVVILYAAGLGATNPPADSFSGATAGTLNWVVDALDIYVGEQKLDASDILFAGLAPGFPGIYQLNVKVPAGLATDRLYMTQGGAQSAALRSNTVQVGVTGGQNVANVSGSIVGIYPPTNPDAPPYNIPAPIPISLPVALQAAAYTVSFDILPGAQPFQVAAVGEAGSSIMTFNPSDGTHMGKSTMPTAPTRAGDFSHSEFPVLINLVSCDPATAVCLPFPSNMIPASMLDPVEIAAANFLPLPNMASPQGSIGFYLMPGNAPAGAHFSLDANNPGLFGAWLAIPYGAFATHTSTLQLFVDGQLVTSTDVTYPIGVHR